MLQPIIIKLGIAKVVEWLLDPVVDQSLSTRCQHPMHLSDQGWWEEQLMQTITAVMTSALSSPGWQGIGEIVLKQRRPVSAAALRVCIF